MQNMTADELRLIELLCQGQSDRKVRAALGMDQNAVLKLSRSVRAKLGIDATVTIRATVLASRHTA
jgi:DNA-binding CsgD family transcriptional regulator